MPTSLWLMIIRANKLIHLIDDERNDIFVHVDKNCDSFPMNVFDSLAQKSVLEVIPRKKCHWAEYSLVDVELDLLTAATKKEHYRYYHLLSGHDLPLKNQDQMHDFFDNHDEEFLTLNGYGTEYHRKYTSYTHFF